MYSDGVMLLASDCAWLGIDDGCHGTSWFDVYNDIIG